MSLRKEYEYGDIEGLISSELFHSVVSQSSGLERKSTFKGQFIPDLLSQDNLASMSKRANQEKLVKLAYLYEISRAIGKNQSIDELCQQIVEYLSLAWCQSDYIFPFIEIDDKCFKSNRFTRVLTHKFSAPIIANERIRGQICLFYEDINLIRWSDDEDAIFLQNVANDLGVWLEQKQFIDVQTIFLNELRMIESVFDEHVGISATDKNGKIKYVNKKFCSVSKYSAGELVGQDHRIINSGYHSKEFMQALWSTITQGETWKGELKNRAKDDTYYWADTTIVPFLDQNGSPYQYVAIRTEVTGYKQLEQRMEMQVRELARSNDELEQFAYVATHDLQEPLRAINSFVQLLKKYCHDQLDARANDLIAHAVAGTNRMQMLIDDLLTYAQVDANQTLMEVDCEILLNNVLSDLSVIISECNAIITYDELPVIRGIPFQFIQLFTRVC